MTEEKGKVVTLRAMGNKKPERPIADEPEMKELKRMIREGELDPDRTRAALVGVQGEVTATIPTREEAG